MKTVSVYGANGFVGSHYVKLSKNKTTSIPRNQLHSETDKILYFIGTNHNYNIFTEPLKDVQSNLVQLINTLEANRKSQHKFEFNFISTWFVYGQGNLPYVETQSCNPRGFYSITKLAAEQMLSSYCDTFEIDYRIIRLGNVFGYGDNKASEKKNALTYLVHRIRANEEIEIYENGEILRDFIHVDDVCKGLDIILESGNLNEIYNLGSGVATKFGDLLRAYAKQVGSSSSFSSIQTPTFHKIVQVKDSYLNIDKVLNLGFRLQRPISTQELEAL
jgi:nucleoside-diphosphate-sugar epimerase